jgi:hypothetical protein
MSEPSQAAGGPTPRRPRGLAERKQLMLAILANRNVRRAALSREEERLLDDWLADRLPPARSGAASGLVRSNAMAAERVLERRLLALASASVSPSKKVEESLLKARAAGTVRGPLRRRLPSLWQWSGIVTAAAAVALATTLVLQPPPSGQATITTVTDLQSLIEAADVQAIPSEKPVFNDVEVPMRLLQGLRRRAGRGVPFEYDQITPFITNANRADRRAVRIIVDSALVKEIGAQVGRQNLTIRVYDLGAPQIAELRRRIALAPSDKPTFLLTVKPSY